MIAALEAPARTLPKLLTPDDLAAIFGQKRKTILAWHRSGRIPRGRSINGSRSPRWLEADLRPLFTEQGA
jgi:predicted DNA-binding transcriptional regulator AlpA